MSLRPSKVQEISSQSVIVVKSDIQDGNNEDGFRDFFHILTAQQGWIIHFSTQSKVILHVI